MLKFAIVGNIASGKSSVEQILKEKGYKVFDTDVISHEILDEFKSDIILAFNGYDILEDSAISRKKLGTLVFENYELKTKLENIIYPELKKRIENIFLENNKENYVFISIPLLFEVKWQYLFDKILFINTDDNIRLERLRRRNNLTTSQALQRINSQMLQEDKMKASDFIICNNDNFEMLHKKVNEFIIQLEDME